MNGTAIKPLLMQYSVVKTNKVPISLKTLPVCKRMSGMYVKLLQTLELFQKVNNLLMII